MSAQCDMCGTIFEPWKSPDVVCKPCSEAFVRFIDETILEELEEGGWPQWSTWVRQGGEGDGRAP